MENKALDEFKSILTRIDLLKAILDSSRPLSEGQAGKLDQKLRLDWNYHSNSIEGNTLSENETRSFILYGITAKGKHIREYIEMRGHNDALKLLSEIVEKEQPITEKIIKKLHRIILVEPYTDDEAEINPGVYKTVPNYLYTSQMERIDFLPPEEVATALNELVNWLNNHIDIPKRKKKQYDLHPILVAAAFQVRFIQIHPFGDGNGRMARILSNLILMQFGYTPAIIRLESRDSYYRLLNLSSLEDPLPLAQMIAEETMKTLQLAVDASKGLPLEEPEDLDKAMSLLKSKVDALGVSENVQQRTPALVLKVLKEAFIPILFEYDRQWARLRDLFEETISQIRADHGNKQEYEWLPDEIEGFWRSYNSKHIDFIQFEIFLKKLRVLLPTIEHFKLGFQIQFDEYEYRLVHDVPEKKIVSYLYGSIIDEKELLDITKVVVKSFVELLSQRIDQQKSDK